MLLACYFSPYGGCRNFAVAPASQIQIGGRKPPAVDSDDGHILSRTRLTIDLGHDRSVTSRVRQLRPATVGDRWRRLSRPPSVRPTCPDGARRHRKSCASLPLRRLQHCHQDQERRIRLRPPTRADAPREEWRAQRIMSGDDRPSRLRRRGRAPQQHKLHLHGSNDGCTDHRMTKFAPILAA
jgi:hypothetical protein